MKILIRQIIVTLFSLLSFHSCTEKIDWETESRDPILVVEADIDDSLKHQQIILTTSSDYFNPQWPDSVSNAKVTVTEGDNIYQYTEVSPGRYLSDIPYQGISGLTYQLDIDLSKKMNGNTHFSAKETMPKPLQIDSLWVLFMENPFAQEIEAEETEQIGKEEMYIMSVMVGQEPADEKSFYRIEVVINDSTTSENYADSYLTTDEGWNGKIEFSIGFNEPVWNDDSVHLYIYSVTKAEHRFLSDIIAEKDGGDITGMFSQPANIEGNISNGAFGCFRLSAITYKSAEAWNADGSNWPENESRFESDSK